MSYDLAAVSCSADLLARLHACAATLDLSYGPGSRMTDVQTTVRAFQPTLADLLDLLREAFPLGTRARDLDLGWFRLVLLGPSQQIVCHRDPSIAPARRFHLPLQTSPGCWSYHAGVWQRLRAGYVYEMDPAVEHGAVNWGELTRIHLLIDVTRRREG